ncbi:N-acetyltransferase family protein [Periweissella cryptocerci]|uniref:N-acetyltransferase family protein n=1 Tax=Periweissella cryptocerci TaxID=2506420 RepID=A0A4P6YVL6_9LACO|nr:GNAT family N-acetyltransferase [Periweissella cryptocerci]QBO36899.1 N-acetyltransferase family protein [Periweissella cryptocerci]
MLAHILEETIQPKAPTNINPNIAFRLAEANDLPIFTAIYNESIRTRGITTDLEEQTVEQRRGWFEAHQNDPRHPIFAAVENNQVVGYGSLSVYRPRKGVDAVAEISYYFDHSVRGKGFGSAIMDYLISYAQTQGFSNLLAFVNGLNETSAGLLTKFGFAEWGRFPGISFDGEFFHDQIIFGRKI